jgi:hypothetical protein
MLEGVAPTAQNLTRRYVMAHAHAHKIFQELVVLRWLLVFLAAILVLLGLAVAGAARAAQERTSSPPVKVTITDEKPVIVDTDSPSASSGSSLPIDPVKRIMFTPGGLTANIRSENNQTLHLSHFPSFQIDGRLYQQGQGGQALYFNRPLPKDKGPKYREGYVSAYKYGDVQVTVTVGLIPTKPAKGATKRHLDSVLIHYLTENKGGQPHKFGLRLYMDTFVIDNDGCLFAAPTMPDKVLNGVELKGKKLPPYVQLLQRPDLKNPGYVSHLSLNLGGRMEKPDRVVLTAFAEGFNTWECRPIAANGDSALAVFWEAKEIKPGGKREVAYAYGKGLAAGAGDGRFDVALGGSFEPGKTFKVSALVHDPAPGQVLSLELPPGMALVEGKELQPVPVPMGEETVSLVVWQARVQRPGEYAVRVHSNTGVTQGKRVNIARTGS